ncbi:MaoC family dehydratase [Hominifimenecus sp. rT4P-3]|uniref:MaoC family dehydratase n=1 Tax=Hominifimenecus sp. rT4P-3 TaxID=3242979 RepID=UPI003DA5E062
MGAAKYFEDFQIGEEMVSRSRVIDPSDIRMFSACTSLCNRIQTDADYCKEIPGVGKPVVAGSHLLNLIDAFYAQVVSPDGIPTFHYGYDNVEFRENVYSGDTVHTIFQLIDKTEKNEAFGVLTFEVKTYNQRGEVVVYDIDKLYCGRRPKEDGKTDS